jgi:hypothetical protein
MFNSARLMAVALVVACTAPVSPVSAGVRPSQSVAGALSQSADARASDVFRFAFDDGRSLRPGTRVRDVTGHGHPATVRVSGSGRLTREDGIVRRGAGFPSACRGCGRALLQVQDDSSLDPRVRAFRLGAAVRLNQRQSRPGRDPNIMQKGLFTQAGGQFKLELVGSSPRCVVLGRKGRSTTPTGPSIDDRRWHRLRCSRQGRTVSLWVDGDKVAQAKGATGRVRNADQCASAARLLVLADRTTSTTATSTASSCTSTADPVRWDTGAVTRASIDALQIATHQYGGRVG